jgi:predicted transcriptional regulator
MKTKTKIIVSFLEHTEPATIKELSKRIKADYRITHTAAQQLIEDGVVQMKKVGNSSLCNLHPAYFGRELYLAEDMRRQTAFQDKNMSKLCADILRRIGTSHFTLLLYGDYARRTATKFSDINLLFISNDAGFPKKVDALLADVPLRVHTTTVTENMFHTMRRAADQNVVKEVVRHNVILHGIESYYALVMY